jgi:hypothetical protein
MQSLMQGSLVFLLSIVTPVHATTQESAVTPVQKVIQLMNGMMAKGKAEKQAEQVQYAAYKQWCDDTVRQKTAAIEEANEMIEVLKADIEKYTAEAEKLSKQIADSEEDITVWTGDQKAATKVREIEKADYDKTHTDYSESIDALERAMATLKKQSADVKQASFAQMSPLSKLKDFDIIPDEAKRSIDSFLSQAPGMDYQAPEANAYEFQSSGIIDMLKDLHTKFVEERTKLEAEETESRQYYEMLMSDLDSEIKNAEAGVEKDSDDKAKALKAKASAEGELSDTITVRDEDRKYLEDTTATCEQKAKDFEARQQLRAEELEAIEKAIEIISSNAVSGSAKKHLPTLLQNKGTSYAQLRSNTRNPAQYQAAIFLQDKARQLGSRILDAMATRVTKDPFKKVKKMIKDLIDKLMEEANEEAAHKGWCDTELATNEKTRKKKTDEVDTLKAEIDELTASIAKLGEEIVELSNAIAELDAAVAKSTEMREDEKAKNAETIKDAQEAQTAVAQALTVLKEFYAKASEATAFVQQPEVFDEPYKGMGGMAGGVVGMLEVIESDFARVQAETSSAEAEAAKEYEEFMHDSKVDKAGKAKDIEHKTTKKQNEEAAVTEATTDLEGTQKELDAALRYYDKLKPSCVDTGVSYEDRVARRKEEIQSLQEALKILNGDDI